MDRDLDCARRSFKLSRSFRIGHPKYSRRANTRMERTARPGRRPYTSVGRRRLTFPFPSPRGVPSPSNFSVIRRQKVASLATFRIGNFPLPYLPRLSNYPVLPISHGTDFFQLRIMTLPWMRYDSLSRVLFLSHSPTTRSAKFVTTFCS